MFKFFFFNRELNETTKQQENRFVQVLQDILDNKKTSEHTLSPDLYTFLIEKQQSYLKYLQRKTLSRYDDCVNVPTVKKTMTIEDLKAWNIFLVTLRQHQTLKREKESSFICNNSQFDVKDFQTLFETF